MSPRDLHVTKSPTKVPSTNAKARKSTGCAFVGAVLGLLALLLMPARVGVRPPSDLDVMIEILWIIGSAALGGMAGAEVEKILKPRE
jgi:hypothetical protein